MSTRKSGLSLRELTLERGCFSMLDPDERIDNDWFHEIRGANGFYHAQVRAEICADEMDKYIKLDNRVKHITIVASDKETPNCFDIMSNGSLKEVTASLDYDFRKWLRNSYQRGYRFIQVEIGK